MKQGMTNVDVAALAAELSPLLVGARIDRVYQPAKEQIMIRLRRKGTGRIDLLFELGKFLTATRRPPENPDKPSMLAQVLRMQLENSRVTAFHQLGFDRLIRMDLERGDGKRSLVFELFGDGNLLLLDETGIIFLPMKGGDFGARRLRKGEPYLPPPGGAQPFDFDVPLLAAAAANAKRDLVRFLALDLGFGPLWGEEMALRAGLPKNLVAATLTETQIGQLHDALQRLANDIRRNDLAPALVYDAGKSEGTGSLAAPTMPTLVDAVPFVMSRYPAPAYSHEEAPSFRDALDTLFVGGEATDDTGDEPEDPRQPRFDDARAKLQRQLDQVDGALGGFEAEDAAAQADGEAVYASFQQVQALLESLQKARSDRPWAQVEAILAKGRAEGNPLALQVPELRPHNGGALFALTDANGAPRVVEVDLRLSVQENAELHFAAAKKSRSRREGALEARKAVLGRIKELEAKGLDGFGLAPTRVEKVSRHFWFESYRWTLTPSGLVAVGGRSAQQNDAVVKKYLRDGDRYVHAEIHGAPSVVVRPAEGTSKQISPEELRIACQFAVVSSRAWRQFGAASAYWVTPAQVSKTPRAGEFVPRGAWIIHGKRNAELGLPMEWSCALVHLMPDGRPVTDTEAAGQPRVFRKLVGGTHATLAKFTGTIIDMVPGTMDPNDAAQALAEKFGVTSEEAQAVLPAGSIQFTGGLA